MTLLKKGNKKKRYIVALSVILIFVVWSFVLFKLSPEQIIDAVGIGNSYIISFVAGVLGGTSIFFPFPYYLFVLTFAAGGANPLVLGIFAGLGVILGESTSYFVGYAGKEALTENVSNFFKKICDWIYAKPKWLVMVFLFIYGAFFPIPNDFLLIPLGIGRYPFWRVIIPLGLGNIVFNISIALMGFYGLGWIF